MICHAEAEDLPAILELQYLAYRSEAELLGNWDIPPLKQKLSEVEEEFRKGVFLKLIFEHDAIVGSVRAVEKDGAVQMERLQNLWYIRSSVVVDMEECFFQPSKLNLPVNAVFCLLVLEV